MTRFRTQIASDVIRDGLGVELLDAAGEVIAEVFRSDANHTVRLSTFGNDVPLAAIEQLITRARVALDPFEDGTPLTAAADAAVSPPE
jgi:hypothetical protein